MQNCETSKAYVAQYYEVTQKSNCFIKITRCKIVRPQKLMWFNIMRSTKSQIDLTLHIV